MEDLELFPKSYYKAEHVGGVGNDFNFISDLLREVTFEQRRVASEAYSKVFEESGRREANIRLVEFVKKCKSKNNGEVVSLCSN